MKNPCDFSCPKCGSKDCNRSFRDAGKFVRVGIGERLQTSCKDTEFLKVEWPYGWVSKAEHINHYCRCCQFEWQTHPINHEDKP